MLRFVVFLSGAVLMSLEMVGSRILAPAFGSSIYIWGALIVVVMAALTLGYYYGGRVADRHPDLAVMGLILAAAGVFIGFLPFWTKPVNYLCGQLGPRTGSLLAATAFFFLPGLLLATISPYAVKLAGRSLTTIGNTAGRMSALSSAGSIIGTLVASFFLIPSIGVRSIVHLLGLILLGMSACILLYTRRGRISAEVPVEDNAKKPLAPKAQGLLLALILAVMALLGLSWIYVPRIAAHFEEARILYERDSLYHHIIVDQIDPIRHLHFDNSYQSAINMNAPLQMVFSYTSYLHLGVVARPRPKRVLFIGLGGGSAPARFLHDYDSLTAVDVVEIDPAVVGVARKYFNLNFQDPRLRVVTQDGRLFVEDRAREIAGGLAPAYDLVVIDAYSASTIPYHLATAEFFRAVRAILAPDGAVASNVIGALTGSKSRLLRSIARTFATIFPRVYLFPVGGWYALDDPYERNVIVIATANREPWDAETWRQKARELHTAGLITEDVPSYAQDLIEDRTLREKAWLQDIPILTDDYAPVDTLQHPLL